MSDRQILILDKTGSPWFDFLKEFFEETPAQVHAFEDAALANHHLDKTGKYDLAFINSEIMTPALIQKIKVLINTVPHSRLFEIGPDPVKRRTDVPSDDAFAPDFSPGDFQRQLVSHLPLPPVIRVLIADD